MRSSLIKSSQIKSQLVKDVNGGSSCQESQVWFKLIKGDKLFVKVLQYRSRLVKEFQGCSRLDNGGKGKGSMVDTWLWVITECHEGS